MITREQRSTFIHDVERRLERLETELVRLDREIAEEKGEAKRKLERIRHRFDERRAEVERRIETAGNASEAAWDEMKVGIEEAWTDMNDAFNRARKEFLQAS